MQHRIDNDKHKHNMLVQQRTALQNNQRLHFMRMARQLQSFAGKDFRTTESENWCLNLLFIAPGHLQRLLLLPCSLCSKSRSLLLHMLQIAVRPSKK